MPGLLASPKKPHKTYAGRRRLSWVSHDIDELTEIRARQRTFDGAYIRASLVTLGYALVILKIFAREFATIGLLFTILAFLMLLVSLIRRSGDKIDFSDANVPNPIKRIQASWDSTTPSTEMLNNADEPPLPASKRVWGKRKFRTAGNVVVIMSVLVVGMEIGILVLVFRLDKLV